MSVITLTTEWKWNDYFIGALKGNLIKQIPSATIIDLAHDIPKFNIFFAAFVVKSNYHFFPEGSIHIIALKSGCVEEFNHIVVKYNNHFFITSDNGIGGLLFDTQPDGIIKIPAMYSKDTTFPELTSFVKCAAIISAKSKLPDEFEKVTTYNKLLPFLPSIEKDSITGSIVFIDSYQNAITNISRELFEVECKNRSFNIFIQSNFYRINTINTTYSDVPPGEIVVLFNSLGLLEIAIRNGSAASLLNLDTKSNIRIKFYDNTNS